MVTWYTYIDPTKRKILHALIPQGGSLPLVNGVITPIRRVITSITHLYITYRAYNPITIVGAHLWAQRW